MHVSISFIDIFCGSSWIICMFLLFYVPGCMIIVLHVLCQVFCRSSQTFSEKKFVHMSESSWAVSTLTCFMTKFVVVIYNTNIMFVFNCKVMHCKDVSSKRFPQPPQYLMWHFVFGSCCLEVTIVGQLWDCLSSMSAIMLIQYID